MANDYIILFEYDTPINVKLFNGYSPNIWQYKISHGTVIVTDDHSVTGYYENNNSTIYNIKSLYINI